MQTEIFFICLSESLSPLSTRALSRFLSEIAYDRADGYSVRRCISFVPSAPASSLVVFLKI
jgi:hypothetical protein